MQPEASVTKGEFARLANVTPGRVSQWLSAQQIYGEAIDGEGRDAKIRPNIALAQLKRTLDLGQRVANGLGTHLQLVSPAKGAADQGDDAPAAPTRSGSFHDEAERELVQLRLDRERRRDRQEREEEAARAGRYVDAEDANRELGRLASRLVSEFEGSLPDLATAIAAQFKLEQRDVLHTLKQAFRAARAKASAAMREGAEQLPPLQEVPEELPAAAE